MATKTVPSFEEILEVQNRAIEMQVQDWIHNDLFTFQFLMLVIILVVPWFMKA